MERINVGCGMTPTNGWLNFDNSMGIKLSAFPALVSILHRTKLVNRPQFEYIEFCRTHKIKWANAARKIELPSGSVEAVYSSHMLEHLDRGEAKLFLREAKRILVPGGTIRLAVPDVRKLAVSYVERGDADEFMESLFTCVPRPRTLTERVKSFLVGERHHLWMYDDHSLCRLLAECGFSDPKGMSPGSTRIESPGDLNLYERADESLYVEATKS